MGKIRYKVIEKPRGHVRHFDVFDLAENHDIPYPVEAGRGNGPWARCEFCDTPRGFSSGSCAHVQAVKRYIKKLGDDKYYQSINRRRFVE